MIEKFLALNCNLGFLSEIPKSHDIGFIIENIGKKIVKKIKILRFRAHYILEEVFTIYSTIAQRLVWHLI